jgi:hypothetical protein
VKKIANTFITIADDCPNRQGVPPAARDGARSIARLHYDLLNDHPYEYDIDALNFEVWRLRNGISEAEAPQHRDAFFSKGHPCMRASPLTKQYGYGAHYNAAGKIAIYPVDSVAYGKLLNDPGNRVEKAMRNKRASAEPTGAHPGRRPQAAHPLRHVS